MKKRIFGLFAALCLMLQLLPVAAAQAALPEIQLRPMAQREEPAPQAGAYTVTLRSSGPGVAELYNTTGNARDRVYFLADPEPGYRVSFAKCGYHKDQVDMKLYYIGSNIYEILMPDGDVLLDLEFVPAEGESHGVEVIAGVGGMVTVSQPTAKAGESIFVEVISTSGRGAEFIQAEAAGAFLKVHPLGLVGGAELYEIFMPDAPLRISVQFEPGGPYPVEALAVSGTEEPGGVVVLSHETAMEGELITVAAIPDRGWEILDITAMNGSALTGEGEGLWSFVMPQGGEQIQVTFRKIAYPVTVTVEEPVGGTAAVEAQTAVLGQTLLLTCEPWPGYRVARIAGAEELTELGGGVWSFRMTDAPAALSVLFLREDNPFLDVDERQYYHDSVIWAAEAGITTGTEPDRFSPYGLCSRAQAVTFLWRAAGCPESTGENPFRDVPAGTWYTDAVLWAVEQGITTGITASTFEPNGTCSRAQAVTFLWRAMGCPEAAAEHSFVDVEAGSWYDAAVRWAVEQGITTGVSGAAFAPHARCNRAQVVTFLYRAYAE